MTEKQQVTEKIQLTAPGWTIHGNILRIFGSMEGAARRIGMSKQALYAQVEAGEISDRVAGAMWKAGVDPREMVREIE